MLTVVARRTSLSAFLVGTAFALAGCTGLISEKPVFGAADYDAGGTLLGHYKDAEGKKKAVVTRGPDGQLTFLGFESKTTKKKGSKDAEEIWTQALYAEAAAVPLGSGDYALQVSCVALAHDGKTYAPWLGGKASPFNTYTAYGFIAEDRKKDHLWFSASFNKDDAYALVFNRYELTAPPADKGGRYDVRIIPSTISRSAAAALFRDLIALDMKAGGGAELYVRQDREPQPDAVESAALVVKDSATCRRLQSEGEPVSGK